MNRSEMMGTAYSTSDFNMLNNSELYDLLKLRMDVFIVEQKCAYADIDGKDREALHISAKQEGKLFACLRILPPDASGQVRLGRIAILPDYRRKGFGRRMMILALELCMEKFPGNSVVLSSQIQVQDFYSRMGFRTVSEGYMEDGIEHVDMELVNFKVVEDFHRANPNWKEKEN